MRQKLIISGLILFGISLTAYCQDIADSVVVDYKTEIANYRKGRNIKMMYSEGSPLTLGQRKDFKGLLFFAIDEKYKVEAKLSRATEQQSVVLKTSTDREPEYIKYGKISFTIDGQELELTVYQSKKLAEIQYEIDEVFVPFRDGTSGNDSYGGGRYVDCELPTEGDVIILDFNKAYNPYCAYNPKYSCVIPPEENRLLIRIEAGEKVFEIH
jgi:hypothetical protein